MLEPHAAAVRMAHVDTVVLGCTHYTFVQLALREMLRNDVMLIETSGAVAERIASIAKVAPTATPNASTAMTATLVFSTGSTRTMHRLARTFLDGVQSRIGSLNL